MCLELKRNAIKRIALRPITCYKVVRKTLNPTRFETEFQNAKVKLGETYHSEIYVCSLKNREVEDGLHSYASLEIAKKRCHTDRYVVVKCRIPMFSRYYVGKFWGVKSYASNKIKYIKKI